MILLFIHAESFSFKVKEKAVKSAEEDFLDYLKKDNTLVVFTTVEKNDNDEIINKALDNILDIFTKVKASSVVIYPYAHLSSDLADPKNAVTILKKLEDNLKNKLEVYRAPFGWYKAFSISCYGHPLSELSRRIRNEKDIQKAQEMSLCEKFGFPYSPKASFMKNAVIKFLENSINPKGTIIGSKDVPKGYLSIVYSKPEGRILPCVNEDPIIELYYNGLKLDYPKSFNDSKNTLIIWDDNRVNIGNLIYYILLKSKEMQTPSLPLWMSPIHVRILPVSEDYIQKALDYAEILKNKGVRVEVDNNNDSLGNKIRRAGSDWIPFIAVFGEREYKTGTLTVRIRGKSEQKSLSLDELVSIIMEEDKILLKQNTPIKMKDDNS
ncbi:threonyl-tRNA synthetase editing domain-containing protein [Acidianus brierleyi]|uniref:threonyl-tRNA synthetase editing domain-containing protein n=1 Tax=Acidianus brierleyi TaxID=41673 RepID=UPI00144334D5|nr:threonyl-tRNA synthetase editing domain-containing protein [Acidianus brierleyi]QIJ32843.1 Ser-tRNA(Thr) hydrolase [Acidianus brierleyi]